jgi:hypothetical protein
MIKFIKRKSLMVSAATSVYFLAGVEDSNATGQADFSTIAENVNTSISSLPGLLTGLAYMFGILLGVLGILKIKDHVENPSQTQLSHGAIRLAAGGALFALPIVYEAMQETIDDGAKGGVAAAKLKKVDFHFDE